MSEPDNRPKRLLDAQGNPIFNGAEETLRRVAREGMRYAVASTDDLAEAFEMVLAARRAGIRTLAIISTICPCGECGPLVLADRESEVRVNALTRPQDPLTSGWAETVN